MSLDAILWALKHAPIANEQEFSVLTLMSEEADPAGCGTFLSVRTIAARTTLSESEVQRCLRDLVKRGVIGLGDQSLAEYIRADRRPTVYDLLIPYRWFADPDKTNRDRGMRGRAPITPENRPEIMAAPPKKRRADFGTRRPRTGPNGVATSHLVDGVATSDPVADEVATRHPVDFHAHEVAVSDPVADEVATRHPVAGSLTAPHGVASKSPRGSYKRPDQVSTNQVRTNPPSRERAGARPPAQRASSAVEGEGTMPEPEPRTPAQLEAAIMAEAVRYEKSRHHGWGRNITAGVLREAMRVEGRTWAQVKAVLARIADDPATQSPSRMAYAPVGWWREAAGPAGPPKSEWCGLCDERTRMVGADSDRPRRCPDCHPNRQPAPAR